MSSESEDETPVSSLNKKEESKFTWMILLFLLYWQSFFRVTETALVCILRFFKYILQLLGKTYQCPQLLAVQEEIPVTFKTALRRIGLKQDGIVNFVVCPVCHSLYSYQDCVVVLPNGQKISKKCKFIKYPNHPRASQRKCCDTKLLKIVKCKGQASYRLVPRKVYSYYPIYLSLARLAKKDGFLNSCEAWRQRKDSIPPQFLGDVYDGEVWNSFVSSGFLKSPYSYLLCFNVDWFQPFNPFMDHPFSEWLACAESASHLPSYLTASAEQ